MPAPTYCGRFAPSPTGPLHLGSAYTALASWLLARQAGGQWLIRIEDLDPPREVAGASAAQLAALQRLGLTSDMPVLRQSQRYHAYQAALDQLLASGQAFACHCSRSDLAESGGVHRDCTAKRQRPTPAIRFRVRDAEVIVLHDAIQGEYRQSLAETTGDFVLRRADGLWAYQLAVVVDDAAQGITDIVRGSDLLDSTPRQIALQRALGLPTPSYAHVPVLLGADGQKLSKSAHSDGIDNGDPVRVLSRLWGLLGQSQPLPNSAPDVSTWLAAAVAAFRPEALPHRTAIAFESMHT
ncbi:MAG: tRNA glutamyl-Q(34) synthetase GluQRS [Gammaproteobacteria bacterium HGW-Gammaproteobacteria-2]|jgi:glutamyl-Q tRNA(Asp) synthetase|nr:MAG: tRNA glutamyl-Q(34) synthetase GluQRS [Gammaproteobacteria bacterium HGW-Gammaproteobacteria-2]